MAPCSLPSPSSFLPSHFLHLFLCVPSLCPGVSSPDPARESKGALWHPVPYGPTSSPDRNSACRRKMTELVLGCGLHQWDVFTCQKCTDINQTAAKFCTVWNSLLLRLLCSAPGQPLTEDVRAAADNDEHHGAVPTFLSFLHCLHMSLLTLQDGHLKSLLN